MGFLHYAPIMYISALTGQRVNRILKLLILWQNNKPESAYGGLNEVVDEALAITPPPTDKGKRLKVYYATQVGVKPPKFVLFVNEPELMHFSYRRYLENQFRKNFGFEGTDIWMMIRKGKRILIFIFTEMTSRFFGGSEV